MLKIVTLNQTNKHDYNQVDNRYFVSEAAHIKITSSGFILSYQPLKKAQWHAYPDNARFSADEIALGKDIACFLAYNDGKLVGQAVSYENWNNLMLLDDLRVDTRYRRQGIGKALLDAVLDDARARNMQGVSLETQDSNPSACQFYEAMGFTLGGLDRYLYAALPHQRKRPPVLRDTALFFYRLF